MMFEEPAALFLLILILPLICYIFYRQWQAVSWIRKNIAHSRQKEITAYGPASFFVHAFLLSAIASSLVLALAGPFSRGEIEVEDRSQSVLICIDASLSMLAQDVQHDEKTSRFDAARNLAKQLIRDRPRDRFGLYTFSGAVAYHTPATSDHAALQEMLDNLSEHAWGQSGTSFSRLLTALLRLPADRLTQILILSDGEIPTDFSDPYEELLPLFEERNVRIHSIAIGSEDGVELSLYHPEDVLSGVKEKRILTQIETARMDAHLKAIARATDGEFSAYHPDAHDEIAGWLDESQGELQALRLQGRKYRTSSFLWLAFVLVLMEGAMSILSRRNLKIWSVLVLPFSLSCTDLWKAHLYNEEGIVLFQSSALDPASESFLKSRSVGVRSEIPIYNEARIEREKGNYSRAHELYEQALKLEGDFAAAHFNDGVLLYEWGLKEKDPAGCHLERTRELWQAARLRFQAEPLKREDEELSRGARENDAFIARELTGLKENPDCPAQSARSEAPAGNGSDGPQGQEPPGPGESAQKPSAGLSSEQEGQLQYEMERIRKKSGGASFKQNAQSQMSPERLGEWKEGTGGEALWW